MPIARTGESGKGRAVSITMRTPGHDAEVAAGFLCGEGLLRRRSDIVGIGPCGDAANVIRVEYPPHASLDLARLERNFYTSSSGGVCGKASLEAVAATIADRAVDSDLRVDAALLPSLAERARRSQTSFEETGGLHAASLFDEEGRLLADALPASRRILLMSGRASFELLQKAMAAGMPVVSPWERRRPSPSPSRNAPASCWPVSSARRPTTSTRTASACAERRGTDARSAPQQQRNPPPRPP